MLSTFDVIEVLLAVAVKVPHRHGSRITPDSDVGLRDKSTCRGTQQYTHGVRSIGNAKDNGQILIAIAIEVTDCYRI